MVPKRGLEPPWDCSRYHLKVVRIPIPPPGHINCLSIIPKSLLIKQAPTNPRLRSHLKFVIVFSRIIYFN